MDKFWSDYVENQEEFLDTFWKMPSLHTFAAQLIQIVEQP